MNNFEELFRVSRDEYVGRLKKAYPNIGHITDKKKPVVIYGAAKMARYFKSSLDRDGIKIAAFADSNSQLWGADIGGIKVIPPEALKDRYLSSPILIASLRYETEIFQALKKEGFKLVFPLLILNFCYPDRFPVIPDYFQRFNVLFEAENQKEIMKVNELWQDDISRNVFFNIIKFNLTFDKGLIRNVRSPNPHYFEPDILSFSDEEIFIDAGGFDGDTLTQFHRQVSGKFRKIYSFEPDRNNFQKLLEVARNLDSTRIEVVSSGLYSKSSQMNFCELNDVDTRISSEAGSVSLPVVSLDEFLENKEPPTYIKMDIEGAEADAILGSKEIIQTHKPKLAISLYHRPTDLWKIPLLVKSLNENYRLYLRHYTDEIIETVLYAL